MQMSVLKFVCDIICVCLNSTISASSRRWQKKSAHPWWVYFLDIMINKIHSIKRAHPLLPLFKEG